MESILRRRFRRDSCKQTPHGGEKFFFFLSRESNYFQGPDRCKSDPVQEEGIGWGGGEAINVYLGNVKGKKKSSRKGSNRKRIGRKSGAKGARRERG